MAMASAIDRNGTIMMVVLGPSKVDARLLLPQISSRSVKNLIVFASNIR